MCTLFSLTFRSIKSHRDHHHGPLLDIFVPRHRHPHPGDGQANVYRRIYMLKRPPHTLLCVTPPGQEVPPGRTTKPSQWLG